MAVPGSFKMCFALLLGSLILGYYGKGAIGTPWLCTMHDYESNNYWHLIKLSAENIITTKNDIDHNIYIITDLYIPRLSIVSETFSVDNVTVAVEWIQKAGAIYTTRIIPQAASSSTGNNSRRLILSYNTGYNFSVVAVTPCNPATTAFIELHHGTL